MSFKQEMEYSAATALEQIFVKEVRKWKWLTKLIKELRGWTQRQIERWKVDKKEWLACMLEFDWTCLHCGNRNFWNKEPGKEKLDYDHIVPVSKGGKTLKTNRQPLCLSFNRYEKRDKTMDFRKNWVNGRFVKIV